MGRLKEFWKKYIGNGQNGRNDNTLLIISWNIFFNPNLWNYFENDLFLIDLDNSIHSQILLNNNLPVFVLREC